MDNPHEFPALISNVWSAFLQISYGRSQGMSGPNPITYQDIEAWKNLTDASLDAREVSAIKTVDQAYMKAIHNGRNGT